MIPMDSSSGVILSVIVPSFNAYDKTTRTVRALLSQRLPEQYDLEVIVVDDGSNDMSADRLEQEFGERIRLIRHTRNSGRSVTRNTGAHAAVGQLLLMLDSDCTPNSAEYLAKMLDNMDSDRVHIGEVRYKGDGFWPIYQRLGAFRRLHAHRMGYPEALSTANMLVDRHALARVGGYDEGYAHYGFEDRDLLLRLHTSGISISYSGAACVVHSDPVSFRSLIAKNIEAAQYTASRFRARHPQAYNRLGFSQLDLAIHPVRSCLGAALGCLLYPMAELGEQLISQAGWPLRGRIMLARVFLASAYCLGSVKAGISRFRR